MNTEMLNSSACAIFCRWHQRKSRFADRSQIKAVAERSHAATLHVFLERVGGLSKMKSQLLPFYPWQCECHPAVGCR